MVVSFAVGSGLGALACVLHMVFVRARAWLREHDHQGPDWWLLPMHFAVPLVLGYLALVEGPAAIVGYAVLFFAVRAGWLLLEARWPKRATRAHD
jgi:hypothetical protein